jgi:hypothetical protein
MHIAPCPVNTLTLLGLLGHQIAKREVIHDILHVLDPVLQPVALSPQDIVLQVQDLEAGVYILDELVDEERALVVAECDSVACKAGLCNLSDALLCVCLV